MPNAQLCKLCRINPAIQTGSHIFNFALIRGAINMNDVLKRDKEVSFKINSSSGVETYIGRAVNVEKIEELFGRSMTSEEISQNNNPFTVDHLLCTICERKFEVIENYFMKQVHNKLKADRISLSPRNSNLSIASFPNVNEEFIRLYVYSLIWRAAEAGWTNFKIKETEKELLRKILSENLDLDKTVMMANVLPNSSLINSIPLIIHFLVTTSDYSENVVFIDTCTNPYFMVLNQFTFQLFFEPKLVRTNIHFLWGCYKFQSFNELVNFGQSLTIGVLSEEFRKHIFLKNIYKHSAANYEIDLIKKITKTHKFFFGQKPSKNTINDLKQEINDPTIPIGIRNSRDRIINIVSQKFMQIAISRSVGNNTKY
jgi:hypothetical protein